MNSDFWHQRWQRNEIGFHRDQVHPALVRHWPEIAAGSKAPVLVPLCGKSLDMHRLVRQGHRVTGVELDERAVRTFFEEADLEPERSVEGNLAVWHCGPYTLYQGDFFDFSASRPFHRVYDRAALVALPPDMRRDYLDHLAGLMAEDAEGLLITLEYPQETMDGPPFSVEPEELDVYPGLRFSRLAEHDAAADHRKFLERGVPWLKESVYRFEPQAAAQEAAVGSD